MLDGYATIFKGIGLGIVQIFNVPAYVDIFKQYSTEFGAVGWILSILSILIVVAIHVLIIWLIIMGIRKYIRFRHTIGRNEAL